MNASLLVHVTYLTNARGIATYYLLLIRTSVGVNIRSMAYEVDL